MTKDEIDQFKRDFKVIVYNKGKITEQNNHIRRLSRFDKNDSHKAAIIRAIDKRNKQKQEFNLLLKGKTYDEWVTLSKRISYLQSRIKSSKSSKYTEELNNIKKP